MSVLRQSAPVPERVPEAYPEAHGRAALRVPALLVRHDPEVPLENSREEATRRARSVVLHMDYASAAVVKDRGLCAYLRTDYRC